VYIFIGSKMKHRITFQPLGKEGLIDEQKTLQEAARELGITIESLCGGKHRCGKCKVIVENGRENLSLLEEDERKLLTSEEIAANYRLSCVVKVRGEVSVFIPKESRGGEQVILEDGEGIAVKVDPVIKKYYVELEKATLANPRGDFERLMSGLKKAYGLDRLTIDHLVLKELPGKIREGGWKVTVTIRNEKEIINIEPNYSEKIYGIAFDIGTTTVVGYLTDLRSGEAIAIDSIMNPQVSYGEDVMSRITYAMKSEDGLEKMNNGIVNGLNTIIENTTAKAGIKPEDISEVTVVGNTAMHHIFLKIDPRYLGVSPFAPSIQRSYDVKARELGLLVNKAAYVHVLPNVAGFVGSDNVGVLIASEPYNQSEVRLTVDIGTNGEIVLGNRKRMIATSCATGPVLEGTHIKHGMRAKPGAIEHLKIDPDTYEVTYKVIENAGQEAPVKPRGICGSGVVEAVAELFKAKIISKNGRFNRDVKTDRLRKGKEGLEFVIARKEETSIGKDIVITQKDVSEVQLAKAALYAGAKILMKRANITRLDKIVLAGAFGNYIDREAALTIGMFPDCPLEKIAVIGNAAGDGARIALINAEKRKEAEKIARKVEYIELTIDPDFETEFVNAMHFPHLKDKFPCAKKS
jgi:uncharacterized 2Fe-2S/4Fe-4S cluster protein (DUF4445 family)